MEEELDSYRIASDKTRKSINKRKSKAKLQEQRMASETMTCSEAELFALPNPNYWTIIFERDQQRTYTGWITREPTRRRGGRSSLVAHPRTNETSVRTKPVDGRTRTSRSRRDGRSSLTGAPFRPAELSTLGSPVPPQNPSSSPTGRSTS